VVRFSADAKVFFAPPKYGDRSGAHTASSAMGNWSCGGWAGGMKPCSYAFPVPRLETSGALRPLIHDMHSHFTLSYAEYQRRKHGGRFINNSVSECVQPTQQFAKQMSLRLRSYLKAHIFSLFTGPHATNVSSAHRINGTQQTLPTSRRPGHKL